MLLLLLSLLQLPKGTAETGLLWQCPNTNSSHQSTMAGFFLRSCLLKWWLVSEVKAFPFLPSCRNCLEIPITEQDCLSVMYGMDGWHKTLGLDQNKSLLCVYNLERRLSPIWHQRSSCQSFWIHWNSTSQFFSLFNSSNILSPTTLPAFTSLVLRDRKLSQQKYRKKSFIMPLHCIAAQTLLLSQGQCPKGSRHGQRQVKLFLFLAV